MIDEIFELSKKIRYVAVYKNGDLQSKSKPDAVGASSSESDRYEELLVNPTLLKLASQRGNIDCAFSMPMVLASGKVSFQGSN